MVVQGAMRRSRRLLIHRTELGIAETRYLTMQSSSRQVDRNRNYSTITRTPLVPSFGRGTTKSCMWFVSASSVSYSRKVGEPRRKSTASARLSSDCAKFCPRQLREPSTVECQRYVEPFS
nr:hypothetical protein CFP56_20588 [Quercus suber]